ncbi:hypothetical protein V8D89_006711 [Ganoderma adspersum]
MVCRRAWLSFFSFFLAASYIAAYELPIAHTDYDRQTCSGMWTGENTYINVTFDANSQGQIASVIYEFGDVKYLGKNTSRDGDLPQLKTYICTSNAIKAGLCDITQEGRFITDLPKGKLINDTSFWIARVSFSQTNSSESGSEVSVDGLWDNPAGNRKVYQRGANHTSPSWRRETDLPTRQSGASLNTSPTGILVYTSPIQYLVRKTGYYCIAVVPLTVKPAGTTRRQAPANSIHHTTYNGTILFRNAFDGKLPASDYPKVNFYLSMFLVSSALAIAWGWLCYQNVQDLLPIQYYLSGFLAFFVIEMLSNWAYYCYLNAYGGEGIPSTVFLMVLAIFDAGRNTFSLFLLLVLSLGLSVVKESLDSLMIRCQLLAGAHFIFGGLYAVGIIELELQSRYAFILLLFSIPLALALSGFLLGWIIYSLNATISQLAAGKQHYKLSMFTWLRRILLMTVVVAAVFFAMWSMRFPARLAEDYGPTMWRSRWWLLDGWRAVLCLVDFAAIAYLWRPSPNHRWLAVFDELPQDPAGTEDHDPETPEWHEDERGFEEDNDVATLIIRDVVEEIVVAEIGNDAVRDDDAVTPKKRHGEQHDGTEHEGQGLMRDD